jgi:hypothetical protein
MATGTPTAVPLVCPRCKVPRQFVNVDGGTLFRCKGCEWYFTLSTQAPTSTANAVRAAGSTTIPVASGGASFTNGMLLLYDTGVNAEVLVVNGSASGTSIPVAAPFYWPAVAGMIKSHGAAPTFGQLLVSSTLGGVGQDSVPANPGYGF